MQYISSVCKLLTLLFFLITAADGGVARHSNAEMVEFTVGVLGSGQVRKLPLCMA